jgi:hypothetical protein
MGIVFLERSDQCISLKLLKVILCGIERKIAEAYNSDFDMASFCG